MVHGAKDVERIGCLEDGMPAGRSRLRGGRQDQEPR